jgi:hypothetical protein
MYRATRVCLAGRRSVKRASERASGDRGTWELERRRWALEGIFPRFSASASCCLVTSVGQVQVWGGCARKRRMYDAQEAARPANQRQLVPEIWLDPVDQATRQTQTKTKPQRPGRDPMGGDGRRKGVEKKKTSAITTKVKVSTSVVEWHCLGSFPEIHSLGGEFDRMARQVERQGAPRSFLPSSAL